MPVPNSKYRIPASLLARHHHGQPQQTATQSSNHMSSLLPLYTRPCKHSIRVCRRIYELVPNRKAHLVQHRDPASNAAQLALALARSPHVRAHSPASFPASRVRSTRRRTAWPCSFTHGSRTLAALQKEPKPPSTFSVQRFSSFPLASRARKQATVSPSDAPCTPPWSLPRVTRAQPRTPPGTNRPTATPPGHGPASQAVDALEPYRKLASPAPVLEHSRSFPALLTYPASRMGAMRPAGRTPKITAARSMPRPPQTLAREL